MTNQSEPAASRGGLDIAREWANLPPDHLEIALKALGPQLERDHEYRMKVIQLEYELAGAKQTHTLYLVGLVAGFVISVGMLIGAVIVGSNDQPWLAAMLSGPSVLALTTVFVLRRSDTAQSRAVAHSQQLALDAAAQASPPSPVVDPTAGAV
ncbi:hypothetical protein [Streptomyces sp. NPDC056987]|uniref:hypothetical protein n=1 Tax=Streptomyces sp. NPDC056987 TaxID=3345988 RepID=UPI003627E9E5